MTFYVVRSYGSCFFTELKRQKIFIASPVRGPLPTLAALAQPAPYLPTSSYATVYDYSMLHQYLSLVSFVQVDLFYNTAALQSKNTSINQYQKGLYNNRFYSTL